MTDDPEVIYLAPHGTYDDIGTPFSEGRQYCSDHDGEWYDEEGKLIPGVKYIREDVWSSSWQPIETAPKADGDRISLALFDDEGHCCWITIGWWNKKSKAWWHNPDGKLVPPTHWMPVPKLHVRGQVKTFKF